METTQSPPQFIHTRQLVQDFEPLITAFRWLGTIDGTEDDLTDEWQKQQSEATSLTTFRSEVEGNVYATATNRQLSIYQSHLIEALRPVLELGEQCRQWLENPQHSHRIQDTPFVSYFMGKKITPEPLSPQHQRINATRPVVEQIHQASQQVEQIIMDVLGPLQNRIQATRGNSLQQSAIQPGNNYAQPVSATSIPPATNEQFKLTHPQIAMLCHYTGQPITRNNAAEVAKKYGKTSPTSGQKLEKTYKDYTSELVRTATAKNTLDNLKAIIPLLSGKALELANRELGEAKKNNRK